MDSAFHTVLLLVNPDDITGGEKKHLLALYSNRLKPNLTYLSMLICYIIFYLGYRSMVMLLGYITLSINI